MDVGTGIALAGVWLFVGMTGLSNTITTLGFVLSLVCAIGVTFVLTGI